MRLKLRHADEARELISPEIFLTAHRSSDSDFGLTSIVIVTCNCQDLTKACIQSIRELTDEPYELIIVDNGSTDGTIEYLENLKNNPAVKVIRNSENRGFPAAANQGIVAAAGRQILLLNNDTIVTTGWLRRMLKALYSSPQVGLVGPVSNNVSGEQQVPVQYNDLLFLDRFAWEWGHAHQGQSQPTDRLVGFCLLVKRDVVDSVGLLDEQFGIGTFEDDDYCLRAIAAGFECRIARDAFVHHVGSQTFKASGIDQRQLLDANYKRLLSKWGLPEREYPGSVKRPAVSGCLIVRDNEQTIRPCLESLAPWVDEVIVVDTGSRDKTAEICRSMGAKVFHWVWRDDFAAARNESIAHATGDWVFWMDSDDVLPTECGRRLRQLVQGQHRANTLGYVLQVRCPGQGLDDYTAVDHVKLFRNRPELRFEFRIHEQIAPAIRRAAGEIQWTDIYVVHANSDRSAEGRRRKVERDLRLLHLDEWDRPEYPFVLFNLGMTYAEANQPELATKCLNRCLELSNPGESHIRKAFALLVAAQMQQRDEIAAMNTVNRGLDQFPGDKELLFRRAMLLHQSGQHAPAAADYERILTEEVDRHYSSRDAGITDYKARHNLALVYEDLGRIVEASNQWQRILRDQPGYAPAIQSMSRLANRDAMEISPAAELMNSS